MKTVRDSPALNITRMLKTDQTKQGRLQTVGQDLRQKSVFSIVQELKVFPSYEPRPFLFLFGNSSSDLSSEVLRCCFFGNVAGVDVEGGLSIRSLEEDGAKRP